MNENETKALDDAYDRAIDWLHRHARYPMVSRLIRAVWLNPDLGGPGLLFDFVTPNRKRVWRGNIEHGCLTQIKKDYKRITQGLRHTACTPELTEEIATDPDIPTGPGDIDLDNLEIFARWQRKIDQVLERPAPVWKDIDPEEFLNQ